MLSNSMHISRMHAMHIRMRLHMRLRGSDVCMLSLLMPPKVHFPLKCSATEFAGKGLEARVLAGVSDQVGTLAERFAADLAFVGFLASMNVSMFLHIRLLVEPFPAVLARVGSGIGVDKQMSR